jgi:hypothetical protein
LNFRKLAVMSLHHRSKSLLARDPPDTGNSLCGRCGPEKRLDIAQ